MAKQDDCIQESVSDSSIDGSICGRSQGPHSQLHDNSDAASLQKTNNDARIESQRRFSVNSHFQNCTIYVVDSYNSHTVQMENIGNDFQHHASHSTVLDRESIQRQQVSLSEMHGEIESTCRPPRDSTPSTSSLPTQTDIIDTNPLDIPTGTVSTTIESGPPKGVTANNSKSPQKDPHLCPHLPSDSSSRLACPHDGSMKRREDFLDFVDNRRLLVLWVGLGTVLWIVLWIVLGAVFFLACYIILPQLQCGK